MEQVCLCWGVSLTILPWVEARSAVVPRVERSPSHDRGKVLVHAMLMLAGDGEACSDIEYLRAQPVAGGWRRTRGLHRTAARAWAPRRCGRFWVHSVCARRCVGAPWRHGGVCWRALDIDSTLVEVHSENKAWRVEQHCQGGRSGSIRCCAPPRTASRCRSCCGAAAAANNIADHIDVLDAAIEQLPGRRRRALTRGFGAAAGAAARRRCGLALCTSLSLPAAQHRVLHDGGNDEVTSSHRPQPRPRRGPALGVRWRALVARADPSSSPSSSTLKAGPSAPAHRGACCITPALQRSLFDSELWRYRGFCTDRRGQPRPTRRPHDDPTVTNRAPSPRCKDIEASSHALQRLRASVAWAQLVSDSAWPTRWFHQLRLRPLCSVHPNASDGNYGAHAALIVRSSRKWTLRLLRQRPDSDKLLHASRRRPIERPDVPPSHRLAVAAHHPAPRPHQQGAPSKHLQVADPWRGGHAPGGT